ncbi:hypothetical protein LJK88_06135 [Paenibacillus sp. P26]|nr:hypothetical protein LJK88_06135 [Paenibacillus sp. P26]
MYAQADLQQLLGSATVAAGDAGAAISIPNQGLSAGSIYVTLTDPGLAESEAVSKSYAPEADLAVTGPLPHPHHEPRGADRMKSGWKASSRGRDSGIYRSFGPRGIDGGDGPGRCEFHRFADGAARDRVRPGVLDPDPRLASGKSADP